MSEHSAEDRWDSYAADDLVDEWVMCRLFGISVFTARSWRTQKRGPRWVSVGRSVRYRIADLKTFVARNSVATTDDPIEEHLAIRRIG